MEELAAETDLKAMFLDLAQLKEQLVQLDEPQIMAIVNRLLSQIEALRYGLTELELLVRDHAAQERQKR